MIFPFPEIALFLILWPAILFESDHYRNPSTVPLIVALLLINASKTVYRTAKGLIRGNHSKG
jgi:hypothetical protein